MKEVIKHPSIFLLLLLLGWCPVLGESYRLGFLPIAAFVFLTLVCSIAYFYYLPPFIQNIFRIRAPLITMGIFFLALSWMGYEKNSLYWILLDLMPFYFLIMGLFLGFVYADYINIKSLFLIVLVFMSAMVLKKIFILFGNIPVNWNGFSLFSATKGGDLTYGIPRIILKGETPFLVFAFFTNLAYFYQFKVGTWLKIFALTLLLLMIFTNRTKSLMLGIFISLMFCYLYFIFFKIKIKTEKKIIFIFSSLVLLAFFSINYANSLQNQIIGIGYRVQEAIAVVKAVGDSIFTGLLPGAGYTYLESDVGIGIQDNYVHFLPFWLFLKGGIILVILFYYLLIKILTLKLSILNIYGMKMSSIYMIFGIFLGLIFTDIMTNQFTSISGSFFLGFSVFFRPKM